MLDEFSDDIKIKGIKFITVHPNFKPFIWDAAWICNTATFECDCL